MHKLFSSFLSLAPSVACFDDFSKSISTCPKGDGRFVIPSFNPDAKVLFVTGCITLHEFQHRAYFSLQSPIGLAYEKYKNILKLSLRDSYCTSVHPCLPTRPCNSKKICQFALSDLGLFNNLELVILLGKLPIKAFFRSDKFNLKNFQNNVYVQHYNNRPFYIYCLEHPRGRSFSNDSFKRLEDFRAFWKGLYYD